MRGFHPVFATFAMVAVLACGGDSTTPTPDDGTLTITLSSALRFQPAAVTIDPGTTVRWVNDASIVHTVTPTTPGQTGVWSRATTSAPGTVLTHTFTVPGQTYSYFCEPHQSVGMTGTITVR